MSVRRFKTFLLAQPLVIMLIFSMSCDGISTKGPVSSCASSTAVIQVLDSGMKLICGCSEPGNLVYTHGAQFTCTVSAGTTAEFIYSGIQQPHSVSITGVISFPERTPDSSNLNQVDAIPLNSSGHFTFSDAVTGTGGTFIVL